MSKLGLPVSDTFYYYRYSFTIIGSLIIIFLVTSYGNFPHVYCLMDTGCENVNWIEIVQDNYPELWSLE
jgi:hypothetical protein